MLKEAKRVIEAGLAESQSAVVMWSGGLDSMLLLYLVRKFADVPILWFYTDDLTSDQKRFAHQIIRDWGLTVFSYQPSDRYFLPNENGVTLINEYSIGGVPFPVLMDVEHGDKCGLEISKERTPYFAFHWKAVFIGWKATDEHFIAGKNPFPPDGTRIGPAKFYAPLRHMQDSDVRKLTRRLGIPVNEHKYAGRKDCDPDYLLRCTACLDDGDGDVFCPKEQKHIPRFSWPREQALSSFRERFLP